jgi:hypothetical protein
MISNPANHHPEIVFPTEVAPVHPRPEPFLLGVLVALAKLVASSPPSRGSVGSSGARMLVAGDMDHGVERADATNVASEFGSPAVMSA